MKEAGNDLYSPMDGIQGVFPGGMDKKVIFTLVDLQLKCSWRKKGEEHMVYGKQAAIPTMERYRGLWEFEGK